MSKPKDQKSRTLWLVQMALLIAIILLLAFTPIGYIKTAGLEITLIMIPVIVGAMIMGPAAGAFLGGVFGLTSFLQCFGLSAFGTTLMGINPVFTFLVCFFPRLFMGWFSGLIFKGLQKIDKTRFLSYAATSLCGALLNTILFMGTLVLCFGRSDFILGLQEKLGAANPFAFILAFVGINGLIEAVVCFIACTGISKALAVALGRIKKKS